MPLGDFCLLRRLLPLLILAACTSRSEVVELAPETFALTSRGATTAAAARAGVENARAHCTTKGGELEVVRSVIGTSDYQIAFRCPRTPPETLTPPAPDATSGLPNPFLR